MPSNIWQTVIDNGDDYIEGQKYRTVAITFYPTLERLGLPKGLLPSGFPTKTLYSFIDYSIRVAWPAHLSRHDLKFLIMFDEEYHACSSALCNFLHSP